MVVYEYDNVLYHCWKEHTDCVGECTYKANIEKIRGYPCFADEDILYWIMDGKLYKEKFIKENFDDNGLKPQPGRLSRDNQILARDAKLATVKQFVINHDCSTLIGITYANTVLTATLNPYHTTKIHEYGEPKEDDLGISIMNYDTKITKLRNDVLCIPYDKYLTRYNNTHNFILIAHEKKSNVDPAEIMTLDQYDTTLPDGYEWFQRNKYFATKHNNPEKFVVDILEVNSQYMMTEIRNRRYLYDNSEFYKVKYGSTLYNPDAIIESPPIKSARKV